jgi:hypothetical protein
MRLLSVFAGILLLSSLAYGRNFISHTVEADLDSGGSARIIERFKFELQNESDFNEFESYRAVSRLDALQEYSSIISPFIQGAEPLVSIEGPSGQYGMMNLEYTLEEFAVLAERTGRITRFRVPKELFLFEDISGNIFIPEKTSLILTLPKDAEIVEEYPLSAIELKTIDRKTVEWRGPLSANDFIFEYNVHGPMEASVGLDELWKIATTFTSAMILITILIGLVILLLFRKKIFRFLAKGFSE